jgi:hypothetical protein
VETRRVLITGIAQELSGALARVLEERDDIEYLVGVDVREPRHDLRRTEFVRADIRNPLVARVITAAESRSYKPGPAHFRLGLEAAGGEKLGPDRTITAWNPLSSDRKCPVHMYRWCGCRPMGCGAGHQEGDRTDQAAGMPHNIRVSLISAII